MPRKRRNTRKKHLPLDPMTEAFHFNALPRDCHYVWYKVGHLKSRHNQKDSDNIVTYKPGSERSLVLVASPLASKVLGKTVVGILDLPNEILEMILRYILQPLDYEAGCPDDFPKRYWTILFDVESNLDFGDSTAQEKAANRARMTLSRTNRRIYGLCKHADQYLHIDVSNSSWREQLRSFHEDCIVGRIRRVHIISTLADSTLKHAACGVLFRALKLCKNATGFRLPSFVPISPATLRRIMELCPNLSIWNRRFTSIREPEFISKSLATLLPNLTGVYFDCHPGIESKEILEAFSTTASGRLEYFVCGSGNGLVLTSQLLRLIIAQPKLQFLLITKVVIRYDTKVFQSWFRRRRWTAIIMMGPELGLVRKRGRIPVQNQNLEEAEELLQRIGHMPEEYYEAVGKWGMYKKSKKVKLMVCSKLNHRSKEPDGEP